ncbi:MAG TPA: protoporphyrinogen oxidase [Actinobacteria bacterium]|nr:protoporphyrinogen oxidase [Actinomycetota bacterium]
MTPEHEVVVVGGGFGGLLVATELAARGRDVLLVDAAEAPGGVAATIEDDGFVLEPAAGTLLLPHPKLTPLLARAGVAVEPASPSAGVRYVWTRGRLAAIPSSPKALITPAISLRGKLRMAFEPFVRMPPPGEEESLHGFLTRRLGDEAGGLLAHVAASGVFAGDPRRLSAAAAFPGVVELERTGGSLARGAIRRLRAASRPRPPRPTSHLPVGGMAKAARTMAAALGDGYRASFPVAAVLPDGGAWRVEGPETLTAAAVVVALRPGDARAVLPTIVSELPDGWPSSPVAVVGIGGTAADVPLPEGFGFLTGPDVDAATVGCLFESSYAPRRAPEGCALAKAIVGGARRPDLADRSDADLVSVVVGDLERALGVSVTPSWTRVVRHPEGIPHYDLGHRHRLSALDRIEAHHAGLVFAGWGYRGIGLAHLAADAARVADRLERR